MLKEVSDQKYGNCKAQTFFRPCRVGEKPSISSLYEHLSVENSLYSLLYSKYLSKDFYNSKRETMLCPRLVVTCVNILLPICCFKHDVIQCPKVAVFSDCLRDWIACASSNSISE